MFDSDFYLQQVWILHLDVKNQKCPTSKIREVWKTTFTFLNVFYIFLNFYVGAVGLNRSPSLKLLLYKFYLNQAAARAHFSPKKCTRHKKSKSHFSNFSNFWPSTFFKIKKISELCRCNSHLAVSDDSYYCIFSVLHMDTKNDPFLSRPSMFVCPTIFFFMTGNFPVPPRFGHLQFGQIPFGQPTFGQPIQQPFFNRYYSIPLLDL